MTVSKRLLRAELFAQLALVILVGLITVIVGVAALTSERNPVVPTAKDALSDLVTGATFAYLLSLGPVALYGAPLYALVDSRGYAKWYVALAVGALPGLGALLFSILSSSIHAGDFIRPAAMLLLYGSMVSGLTHALYKRKRVHGSVA